MGFDFFWRCPKRRKSENWGESGGRRGLGGVTGSFSGLSGSARFGRLKSSLNVICSLEDLEERMRGYMSLGGCEEVFEVMMLVAKVFRFKIYDSFLFCRRACEFINIQGR